MKRRYTMDLYNILLEGNLESVKEKLTGEVPKVLISKISLFGDIALHIAVRAGHVKIVQELVLLTPKEDLIRRNDYGETALTLAAAGGVTKIARLLVKGNSDLLIMENFNDNIPVVVAAQIGHKDMVDFLYKEYLKADSIKDAARTFSREADSSKHAAVRTSSLKADSSTSARDLKADWARLLTSCITSKLYDIASDMVKNYKELSIAALKDTKGEPLNSLARRRTAFESGSDHFAFWQRWICSCLHVQTARGSSNILVELSQLLRNFLKYVPFIKHTYEKKKLENAAQARHLLSCICEQTSTLPGWEIPAILCRPVLTAVLCGNVGFIAEVAKTHPDILWLENGKEGRPLFSTAISERQEKVFSYLRRMGATQCLLATTPDKKKKHLTSSCSVGTKASAWSHFWCSSTNAKRGTMV